MSYTIKLTNGHELTTISDTSVDTTSSLYLVGRNYRNYGEFIADNFVHQLENFAFTSAPSNPLVGQLWFDSSASILRLWNGTAWVMAGLPPITDDGAVYTDTMIGFGHGMMMLNLGQNSSPNLRRYQVQVSDLGDWQLQLLDDHRNVVATPLSIVGREPAVHGVTPLDSDQSTKLVTTEWVKRNFVTSPLDNATIIDALGFTPLQQGDGVNEDPDKVKIGWHPATSHLAYDVDSGGHTGDLATTADLSGYATRISGEQVGVIKAFAGANPPSGYLVCAGQAVSRTAYAALYAALGTIWGAGDGTNTFNLPDFRGRFLAGADNMGGNAAGRLTGASNTNAALGGTGGHELVQYHNHSVTDPGHGHGISDPGHSHGVSDAGHSHGLNDGGHSHGVSDPGHHHTIYADNFWPFGEDGSGGWGSKGTDYDQGNARSSHNGTGININTSNANISIGVAGTGININGSGTGVGVNGSYTGIAVNAVGGGNAQNVPPVACVNYIIFAGV